MHGGLVAAVLDEATGLVATYYRFPSVTARLLVRYRRPVPINAALSVTSRVERERGRTTTVAGELRGVDGEVLAEARSAYLHVAFDHFLATPEGQAVGRQWRGRLGLDAE